MNGKINRNNKQDNRNNHNSNPAQHLNHVTNNPLIRKSIDMKCLKIINISI